MTCLFQRMRLFIQIHYYYMKHGTNQINSQQNIQVKTFHLHIETILFD